MLCIFATGMPLTSWLDENHEGAPTRDSSTFPRESHQGDSCCLIFKTVLSCSPRPHSFAATCSAVPPAGTAAPPAHTSPATAPGTSRGAGGRGLSSTTSADAPPPPLHIAATPMRPPRHTMALVENPQVTAHPISAFLYTHLLHSPSVPLEERGGISFPP